jgi:hypothetical protein
MFAADPPGIIQPGANDEQSGMIEIVATRPDQAQRIDRRIYRVKENPHSAQADTLQLLRGLPAVTITPDEQILLLGAPNVTVQVDDRPIHGDVTQYLRTLHGGDIERIEVITNPSAQYSPEGAGGIINLVLRKKKNDGLSGSANVEASSLGHANADATLKDRQGKWTYELQAQGNGGRGLRSSYHIFRTVEETQGGSPTINTEDGSGSTHFASSYISGKATREIDDRTSISAQAFGAVYKSWTNNEIEFRGLTPDFLSFDERQHSTRPGNFLGLDLDFDHKGKTDGETLKASARVFGNPANRELFRGILADDGAFTIDRREPVRYIEAQTDWVHPIGKKQILSIGARWFQQKNEQRYRFTNRSSDPSLPPDQANSFQSLISTISAYATFQQQIGTFAVMPGVRIERYSRRVSTSGLPSFDVTRTKAFPSFHVDHPLRKTLDLALSYSKRIDRPQVSQLQPYPIVTKANAIDVGNPSLLDQSTDAYEINLHYHRKQLDMGVIVYDRETSHLFSPSYSVNEEGLNVVTTINAGRKRDRGAEFDISTPLVKRVKATASVNLFDSRVPIDPVAGDGTIEAFRYTGNATLEWDGPERRGKPGDIGQLQIVYEGPSRSFQIREKGDFLANLSYTHSFNRTLSLNGTVSGIGTPHSRHRLLAPLVQEDFIGRRRMLEFRLKLIKTFGAAK